MAFDEAARRTAELVAVHAVPCPDSSAETDTRGNAKDREAEYALKVAALDVMKKMRTLSGSVRDVEFESRFCGPQTLVSAVSWLRGGVGNRLTLNVAED